MSFYSRFLFVLTAFPTTSFAESEVAVNLSVWDALLSASPVVQLTLVLLVGMSIGSWAIIISKRRLFVETKRQNKRFLDEFWKAESLDRIYENLKKFPSSTTARVFGSGYAELQRVAEHDSSDETPTRLQGADNIERALNRATENEIDRLESRLSFLATTGSTGPFIGLFGTVWGIMGAFQQIGAMKSASLAVVAPGISEALVATAIGLAAAIPAVMGYNHFLNKLRRQEIELNNFSTEYLNILKRNFFKES